MVLASGPAVVEMVETVVVKVVEVMEAGAGGLAGALRETGAAEMVKTSGDPPSG